MQNNILYDRFTALPNIRGHFYRQRINQLLTEALECHLIVVTAGAGCGKTQAVSYFMSHSDNDFIWLQLSKLDNYSVRFWENFIHAVSVQNPELDSRLSAFEFPDTPALFHTFLHTFADFTSDADKLVFIVDDVHLINEPSVLNFIENLIYARLKNLSVILIGRSMSDLNIRDLSASGDAYFLTEDALGFTEKEAEGYFKEQGLSLSKDSFDEIYAGTAGWISALYLISISLNKNNSQSFNMVTVARRQIFELFGREMFLKYPEEIRRMLAGWALLGRIPEDYLKKHSKNALNIINDIVKTNLFIRFNPITQTYDIHHLFLEFLLEKQDEYLTDEELMEEHLKAADWYHKNGNEIEALSHYQECGRHEEIWNIIKNYELQKPAEIARLFLEAIESFPIEFIEENPLTRVQHASLYLNTGDILKGLNELTQILDQYEPMPLTKKNKTILGETYLFMAMISLLLFDFKFRDYYKKADEYLPEGSSLIDNRASFGDGYFRTLIKEPVPGELNRFLNAIAEAMPYGARAMHGAAYGVEYLTQAEAAYYINDMKKAENCAYQAIYYSLQKNQYDTTCFAYFILVQINVSAGNYIKTEECVRELNQLLEQAAKNSEKVKYLKNCVYTWGVLESWYYSRLGRRDKIPDWILREESKRETYYQIDAFVKAYCLLEDRKYSELTAFLESLEIYYNTVGLLIAKIYIKIFKAVTAQKTDDISKAVAAFTEAYKLACANSLIMPFIELGKHITALIPLVKQYGKESVPEDWLDMVYTKARTYSKNLHNLQAQYIEASGLDRKDSYRLTNREKEMLGYLCRGLTNSEIADSCFITTSAVKKMLNNIYIKLNATNRADAVRTAIQMGLGK